MKTLFITSMLILTQLPQASFAIDDSLIFENIDSQESLHKQVRGGESYGHVSGASDKQIIVEESILTYNSPTSSGSLKFAKEKAPKKITARIKQRQKEKLAQELNESSNFDE